MTPLEQAIHRANARLRAWRELGVPINAPVWVRVQNRVMSDSKYWCFYPVCAVCKAYTWAAFTDDDMLRIDMEEQEREALQHLIDDWGCPHLSPMLRPPPPEFETLVGLCMLEAP